MASGGGGRAKLIEGLLAASKSQITPGVTGTGHDAGPSKDEIHRPGPRVKEEPPTATSSPSPAPMPMGRGQRMSPPALPIGRGRGLPIIPSLQSPSLPSLGRGRGMPAAAGGVKAATTSAAEFSFKQQLLNQSELNLTKTDTSAAPPAVARSRTTKPYENGTDSHTKVDVVPHKDDPTDADLRRKMEELSVEKPAVVMKGEAGKKISVFCNYVPLLMDPNKGAYEYEVRFEPQLDYTGFRIRILNEHVKKARGARCFDGRSRLYLPEKITDTEVVFNSKNPSDDSPVLMRVIYKKPMRLIDSTSLYNVLLNNCTRELASARLGRKYYDCKSAFQVPQHKLEIWPGYVTAVEEFEGGVYLCCDTAHRVLRKETPYEVIRSCLNYDRNNYQDRVMKELLGEVVLTRYNNKFYRIDDIVWDQSPMNTFATKDGSEITYVHYYKHQYDLDIDDIHQPLLISKPKRTEKGKESTIICLVPELCYLTGLTDKMRSDFKVMKDIAIYTKVSAAQRDLGFRRYIKALRENENCSAMLGDWGLRVAPEPVRLDARVLPSEKITYGKGKVLEPENSADWMRSARSNPVLRSVQLSSWLLVFCERDERRAAGFASLASKCAPGLGLDMYDPLMVRLRNDRIETYTSELKSRLGAGRGKDVQIVVVMFPTRRDDRYQAVKRLLCKELPVPSQVVISQTISREEKMRPIVQNIMLQMNVKLGGALWKLHIPLKNVMVCGIDTYHDAGHDNSVGALVASLDADFTKYFSKVCIQPKGRELLEGLTTSFIIALQEWLRHSHRLPDLIVVFRDGVGDGQLKMCKEQEIDQFLDACKRVSPDYSPKLTYIIVQKRINTRYYQSLGGNKVDNAPPGTVLDHTVTRRNYYDFFLVSQLVRQGTASPTHYIVLHDDSDLKVDHVQKLSYKFCHMYYNWPGTVRVPAPCQYAHKLAYLVGTSVKGMPHESLDNLLYYL